MFYNNRNDTEDTGVDADAISEFGHMINYVPGSSSDVNPQYADPSNFDFTPISSFAGIDRNTPTPYKWFGSTADDIGLNKFSEGESISVF